MTRLKKEHILIAGAELEGKVKVSERRRDWMCGQTEAKMTEVRL